MNFVRTRPFMAFDILSSENVIGVKGNTLPLLTLIAIEFHSKINFSRFRFRFWWIFSVCLSIVLCCWSVWIIWMQWNTNPVNMNFTEMESTISDIPFPTVTICPEAKGFYLKMKLFDIVKNLLKNGPKNLTARE